MQGRLIFYKHDIGSKYEDLQTLPFSFCKKVSAKFKEIDGKTAVVSFQMIAERTCSEKEGSTVAAAKWMNQENFISKSKII